MASILTAIIRNVHGENIGKGVEGASCCGQYPQAIIRNVHGENIGKGVKGALSP